MPIEDIAPRVESKTILSFQIDSEKATISVVLHGYISSITLYYKWKENIFNFCPLVFNNNKFKILEIWCQEDSPILSRNKIRFVIIYMQA